MNLEEVLGPFNKVFIDPPSGWMYGFPDVVTKEVFSDPVKLKEFVLSKGYPEKDWEWARNHVRVWKAS